MKRYEVRKTVSLPDHNNMNIWCRGVATIGYSISNPNFGAGWCEPVSVSSNSATLRTYIYEVWDLYGNPQGCLQNTHAN